jgi:hypothetical protein
MPTVAAAAVGRGDPGRQQRERSSGGKDDEKSFHADEDRRRSGAVKGSGEKLLQTGQEDPPGGLTLRGQ